MERELRSKRGASMVEFVIILPLLLLLVFGAIDFGLALYNKAVITNASREGARAGIVFDPSGTYPPLTNGDITEVINSYTSQHLVTFAATPPLPNTTILPNDGCTSRSNHLTVTVTYPYTFLAFPNVAKLIGPGMSGMITLSAQTVMRCE